MKIAQVIDELRVGGAERLFVDLVNTLGAENVSVILLSDNAITPNLAETLDQDVDLYKISVRKRTLFVDIFRLAMLMRRLKLDVVHSHTFWPNLYASLAARIAKVPVVFTSEHGRNEWKRPWHRWLESWAISPCAHLRLCVSQDILDVRHTVDRVPLEKLVLVPNGTRIPATERESEPSQVIVGSVGRLVSAKDFPTLIRAIGILRDWKCDIRLEIVGEGVEEMAIRKEIERLRLSEYVTLAGYQSNVTNWLDRWTIFAISSINEGQPIALLEAMAHGLPCVATDVGGIPNTLSSEVDGILVEPQNPEALAKAILQLIENPELRRALGQSARSRARKEFSIDALALRCLQLYKSVHEARRVGSAS